MIRIYFDWNVISNLKRPEYENLKKIITENENCFQFLYSPAHFKDLMKSYNSENEYFFQDLETLNNLTKTHLIRWEDNQIKPKSATPKEYFESIKNKKTENISSLMDIEKIYAELDEFSEEDGIPKFGNLMKSIFKNQPTGIQINEENKELLKLMFPDIQNNSTMWDIMKGVGQFTENILQNKEYYRNFRKKISDKGGKLTSNSGNWDVKEVINKIDKFLETFTPKLNFVDYVKKTFESRKEPVTNYEFFTSAYFLLDIIGYKSDKLPKQTDNAQNITTDGEHSFYGAHCDFFVANDKKLLTKTKVLYSKFNISTKVLTPNEFSEQIQNSIHTLPDLSKDDFVADALKYIDFNNTVEFYKKSDEYATDTYAIKLPNFYFHFFNYVIYQYFEDENLLILTFNKRYKNYSRFVYFTELENLIDNVVSVFGYNEHNSDYKNKKKDFIYENNENKFIWQSSSVTVILEKEVEKARANLIYIIKFNV